MTVICRDSVDTMTVGIQSSIILVADNLDDKYRSGVIIAAEKHYLCNVAAGVAGY